MVNLRAEFNKIKLPIPLLMAVVIGAGWYLIINGGSFNPLNISWLFNQQDMAQHFLGWEFFRHEPFTFPVGMIHNYGYPFGTSLTYTDSIPLAGILFKLFEPALPDHFQYFGIWSLLSFILQAYFSILILRKVTSNLIITALGASLLILSPNMLFRYVAHISLVSHWLLLWAIYILMRDPLDRKKVNCQWLLLFICASAVHIYFIPMVFTLYVVYLLVAKVNGQSYKVIFIDLCVSILVIVSANYVIGNFIVGRENLVLSGLGYYSMNLDALFDPLSFSRLMPELPKATDGQYEGFNYLGLGNIILLVISISLILGKYKQIHFQKRDLLLIGGSLLLTLIALSDRITFGNRTLLLINLPDPLSRIYEMFRSTGRFFWPVFYLMVIAMLGLLISKLSSMQTGFLLTLIVAAQFFDISPLIQLTRDQTQKTWETPLKNEVWDEVPDFFNEVIIYPAEYLSYINNYQPIAYFAATHELKLNAGYMARWPEEAMKQYGERKYKQLTIGKGNSNILFVIMDPNALSRVNGEETIVLNIDGYLLAFSRANTLLQSWPEYQYYEVQANP